MRRARAKRGALRRKMGPPAAAAARRWVPACASPHAARAAPWRSPKGEWRCLALALKQAVRRARAKRGARRRERRLAMGRVRDSAPGMAQGWTRAAAGSATPARRRRAARAKRAATALRAGCAVAKPEGRAAVFGVGVEAGGEAGGREARRPAAQEASADGESWRPAPPQAAPRRLAGGEPRARSARPRRRGRAASQEGRADPAVGTGPGLRRIRRRRA